MPPTWAVDQGGTLDIQIPQGKTWRLTLHYAEDVDESGADPVPVNPISLEGLSARAQVRRNKDKASELVLDITPYITLEPAAETGRIDIEVPATITADVTKRGHWDLELFDPLDPTEVAEIVQGRAGLDKEVTG